MNDEPITATPEPDVARPSPLADVSPEELAQMQENIRWFSRFSTGQKLAIAAAHRRRALALCPELAKRGS